MSCEKCGRSFERYTQRRSLKPVSEGFQNHVHHGLAYYRHGICSRNHFTKLERTHIEWSPCIKCTRSIIAPRQRPKSAKRKQKRPKPKRRAKSVTRNHKSKIPDFLMKEIYGFSPPPPPPSPPISPDCRSSTSSPFPPPPPPPEWFSDSE